MKHDFDITGCLVEKDGKFLIVQESKPGRTGLYNLPSGHIDDLETVAEATIREVEEESGYKVELTGFIGVYQSIYPDANLNVSGPVFLAKVVGGDARPTSKHPEVKWLTPEEMLELHAAGKFWTKYPAIAVQDYLRRGRYPLEVMSSGVY